MFEGLSCLTLSFWSQSCRGGALAATMKRGGWSVLALARRFSPIMLVDGVEAARYRRARLTVWHRPTRASAFACGEGYCGGHRWWSRSHPCGGVMTMAPGCNLEGVLSSMRCVHSCVGCQIALCGCVVTVFAQFSVN